MSLMSMSNLPNRCWLFERNAEVIQRSRDSDMIWWPVLSYSTCVLPHILSMLSVMSLIAGEMASMK
uniref:Uncharacterized protein n=1 Tax=Arundo donax TaxID=35708 RepID=A0A0A9FUQ6_ARUDO